MAREPLVIRARVRAWLLGIRLLTLDAHITATSEGDLVLTIPAAGGPRAARHAAGASRAARQLPGGQAGPAQLAPPAGRLAGQVLPPGDRQAAGQLPGSSVARARQLVEQGNARF
jgi:hypothetical protein